MDWLAAGVVGMLCWHNIFVVYVQWKKYFGQWKVSEKSMNLKLPWYWLPCTWWPWHWIFKVEFLNGCISGTWCPIGKKRKWYELKQCWSHNLTLTFDLPMTIFQLLNLRKGLSVWHEMKGIWIDTWYFDISVTYPQGFHKCYNTPMFYVAAIFVKYCYTTDSWLFWLMR